MTWAPEEELRMYTGIVEELGEVVGVERLADAAKITVKGPLVTSDAGHGDSLNINGVCLTVTGLSGHVHRRRHAGDPQPLLPR
jgi:riboflavin synthase alpha subunit